MGFVDYFLIVWDFIKYAKDHGISVGPGRGSAVLHNTVRHHNAFYLHPIIISAFEYKVKYHVHLHLPQKYNVYHLLPQVEDFYRACLKEGINPILGCEVYVAPNSRFDRENRMGDERYYHLVLLAENNKGYQNLMKIVSKSFTEGFYYKPRVDYELLQTYHEGIIALSACLAGEVANVFSMASNAYGNNSFISSSDFT